MISIIVAMSVNRVIGRNGELPWHIPNDLKRFKKLTMGHKVIVGRKTYDSIKKRLGGPLPGRINLVLSRDPEYRAPGSLVMLSLEEALRFTQNEDEVFVIGGDRVYQQALPRAQKVYLTLVHAVIDGDAFFPALDVLDWQIISYQREVSDQEAKLFYSFIELRRRADLK